MGSNPTASMFSTGFSSMPRSSWKQHRGRHDLEKTLDLWPQTPVPLEITPCGLWPTHWDGVFSSGGNTGKNPGSTGQNTQPVIISLQEQLKFWVRSCGHRVWHLLVWSRSCCCRRAAASGMCHLCLPPWPNGQGVGLLIRRLRARVPQGVCSF